MPIMAIAAIAIAAASTAAALIAYRRGNRDRCCCRCCYGDYVAFYAT